MVLHLAIQHHYPGRAVFLVVWPPAWALARGGARAQLAKFPAAAAARPDFEMLDAWQASHAMAPVTAMLLADSGYAPLNPPEWLAALQPQAVLLSVSAMDAGGLPDPETLQAVEGYPLLRTDRHGWIELTTDGEQMWIEVEQK